MHQRGVIIQRGDVSRVWEPAKRSPSGSGALVSERRENTWTAVALTSATRVSFRLQQKSLMLTEKETENHKAFLSGGSAARSLLFQMCPIRAGRARAARPVHDIHTQLMLGLTSCGEAATLAGSGLFFIPSRVSLSTMCHVLVSARSSVIGSSPQLWSSCLEQTENCFLSPG